MLVYSDFEKKVVSDDQMDIEDENDINDTFQRGPMPSVDPIFQKAPVMFNRPPPNFGPNAMQSAPTDFADSNDSNDRGKYS